MRELRLAFLLFSLSAFASTPPMAASELADSGWVRPSPTRTQFSLNGTWEWKREGQESWQAVELPAAFEFVGEATFRRSFVVDSTVADRDLVLVGWGVNHQAVITVNGKFVGSHSGYFSGFESELPPGLVQPDQANQLVLNVSNRLDPRDTLPLKHQPLGPRNYGGIFREIFLFAVPKSRVLSVRTAAEFSPDFERCRLTLFAGIKREDGGVADLRCRAQVWDPSVGKPVAQSADIPVQFEDLVSAAVEVPVEISLPRLWNPEDPFLYELRVQLWAGDTLSDVYRGPLGLRSLALAETGLSINGRVVRATGVDWIEGYGPNGTPVASEPALREQVDRVKELGARFLRIIGHPPHPRLLDLADQAGLLVFLEIPLRGVPSPMLNRPAIGDHAVRQLTDLIQRYGGHPSVAAWGLGYGLNVGLGVEPDDRPGPAVRFLARLREIANSLDDRPVYYVARSMAEARTELPVDMVIIDMFQRQPKDILRALLAGGSESIRRPLLVRLGYTLEEDAPIHSNGVNPQIRVQEQQAYRLLQAMARVKEMGVATGVSVTALTDWPVAGPILSIPPVANRSTYRAGLIGLDGEKRVSFNLVQAEFTGDMAPHVSRVVVEEDQPTLLPVLGVVLMLVFAFFLNRDRRLRGHLRRVFVHPHGFYQELRDMRKIPPFLTVLLMTTEVTALAALFAGAILPFRESWLFDEIARLFLPAVLLKVSFNWLVWHPFFLVVVLALLTALLVTVLAVYLGLVGIVLGKPLPFGQLMTLVVWAGASTLWLLVAVPVFHRLMLAANWRALAISLLLAFWSWFIIRMIRAVRAVYFLTLVRGILVIATAAAVALLAMAVYYGRSQALFDYLPYYWTLLHNL